MPQRFDLLVGNYNAGMEAATLSARLDRLPATCAVWKLILLLSCGLFFELYDLLFTAYVAPALVAERILTPATPGLFGTTGVAGFIAALFFGLFIATLICGFLADKFGRRAIFTWSLLWYTASTVIMAFQTTAGGLNFWRFMAGLGIGVEIVTIGTYLTELAPKHMRGRAFAISQTIGFSAVPVVAALAYLLVPTAPLGWAGWRWVVLLGAHGALFVWWIRRRLPESPRWLAQQGRFAEAQRIVDELETRVQREYGRPLPAPAEFAPPETTRGAFREMWRPPYRRRTVMLMIFHVFQTIGYYGFANWVPTLLIQRGITITSSLLYTSIIAIAAPLGPLLGFFIADRLERKTVIVSVAGMNIVCGLIFSQVSARLWIVAMGVCLTLAGNIISYSFHLYQQELFPTAIRSRAAGFVYSWSRLSAIFNAFVIEFFLGRFGVTGVFLFIAAAMAVVMLTIGLMGPRTTDIALEELSH
jgi:MFS transporter, putative metabolite:H+ symporter